MTVRCVLHIGSENVGKTSNTSQKHATTGSSQEINGNNLLKKTFTLHNPRSEFTRLRRGFCLLPDVCSGRKHWEERKEGRKEGRNGKNGREEGRKKGRNGKNGRKEGMARMEGRI
jgi:hypothetical protein